MHFQIIKQLFQNILKPISQVYVQDMGPVSYICTHNHPNSSFYYYFSRAVYKYFAQFAAKSRDKMGFVHLTALKKLIQS